LLTGMLAAVVNSAATSRLGGQVRQVAEQILGRGLRNDGHVPRPGVGRSEQRTQLGSSSCPNRVSGFLAIRNRRRSTWIGLGLPGSSRGRCITGRWIEEAWRFS